MIACIARFAALLRNDPYSDAEWASALFEIWSIVEPSCYFIAGVLPTVRPLMLSLWSRAKSFARPSTSHRSKHKLDSQKQSVANDGLAALSLVGSNQAASRGANHAAAWSNAPSHLYPMPGDGLALLSYPEHAVLAGNPRHASVGDSELGLDGGQHSQINITRTQEVVITRETV